MLALAAVGQTRAPQTMRLLLLGLFSLTTLSALPLGAAPIRYQVNVSVPVRESHALSGARINVDMTWDPSSLRPFYNQVFEGRDAYSWWPLDNSEGVVSIAGGTIFDGVFPVSFGSLPRWEVGRRYDSTHAVGFPGLVVDTGRGKLELFNMVIRYGSTPFTTSLPVYPEPFTAESVVRGQVALHSLDDSFQSWGVTNVSGRAIVPEPATLGLCVFGALATVRRRR